ncbi:MAG: radical SAM protein [Planctomycetota bacterium]
MAHLLRRALADTVRDHPTIKEWLRNLENRAESVRHSVAGHVPGLVKPRPYKVMIAVTAHCNARCEGCRYGRDFMPGSILETDLALQAIDDAAEGGFHSIRLYGGEPLLHPDLDQMVARCVERNLRPYVTTNGILVPKKLAPLVDAGLRDLTFGFYGADDNADTYTGIPDYAKRFRAGLEHVRDTYGDLVDIQLNYLLKRPTCSVEDLHRAFDLALEFQAPMRVDLVHYSLPYFQEGPEARLQFRPEDRPRIEAVVEELVRLKREHPDLLAHTIEGLRSIPDWLCLGPDMRVPCTAYEMIWIGADGTVQMCYVTFEMGNLHQTRLKDMLFQKEHRCAARDAFTLNCPNCHCSSNERVMRHAPSRKRYAAMDAGANAPVPQPALSAKGV